MELFASDSARREIIARLRHLGYVGQLIEEGYSFIDHFSSLPDERQVAAAAFAHTPVSYESACIGVVQGNGAGGAKLIDRYRALGAPVILEIGHGDVTEWGVSREVSKHVLIDRYPFDRIGQLFVSRAADWKPDELLRSKNIGKFQWSPQPNLFAGLLPELEEHVQENLEPLLLDTLSATKESYQQSTGRVPDEAKLFRLVFSMLTAKVFQDRRVKGFVGLGPDADSLLEAVARQYNSEVPQLLNREARDTAAARIWANLDFRNLSVEVLAQIWSSALLDEATKRRLGIHRTSRSIVRYVIERVPFKQVGDDKRIILEPCCGSGVFLIGAMNQLRKNLYGATPAERHGYFTKHLAGIEKDAFGVEISRLALTLADFPNPGGWDVVHADVFDRAVLSPYLRRSGVVLCNPPFGDFTKKERLAHEAASPKKPVELLNRVMDELHPQGVIGFVLPRNVIDGRGYSGVRKRLAERFANLDLTILPDRAFDADSEVGLLVATNPIPHRVTQVANRRVMDDQDEWERFEIAHTVTSQHFSELNPDQARGSLAAPELPEVWDYLIHFPPLEAVAHLSRGIEWNRPLTEKGLETGNRADLVRTRKTEGFWPGVPPKAKFNVFERPEIRFLSLRSEDARGHAYKQSWNKPKAIVNKAARSRGRWRLAAFPDSEGLACYQTFIGVWPSDDRVDEILLSAVLNSPVANAFVSTREGKTDITLETIARIPVPHFTPAQADRLRSLVRDYQRRIQVRFGDAPPSGLARVLMEIDSVVLDAYMMPPRIERQILDFFTGQTGRKAPHGFGDYVTAGDGVYFSLSDRLSPAYEDATAGALLKRIGTR